METTCQSDVGRITRLVLKHVRDAFVSQDAVDGQWRQLNYLEQPDFARAVDEYDAFVALLGSFGIAPGFLPSNGNVALDSTYLRDVAVPCEKGLILCNMGKPQREREPGAAEAGFRKLDLPIHGAITGDGRLEGGDVCWLDERTVVVGRGYRTNDEGILQFRELLGDCIDELIVVPLPHWHGPSDVFHLMSILSPVDRDLAVVYSPLMPVPLRESLVSRGIKLVEVPETEFATLGCNVLAVAPRTCIVLAGNTETKRLLESAGVVAHEYEGREISMKGGGGPTCLTRPIERVVP